MSFPYPGNELLFNSICSQILRVQERHMQRHMPVYAKGILLHVCSFWQGASLSESHGCSPPSPSRVCQPSCPNNTSSISHRNSLASVTAGGGHSAHTQSRSEAQTQLCCLQRVYPFDPLTGTRRISKREEKPQSRSTSQSCALSIGSCRTAWGSGGWQSLSQEAITLLSGSEVCLERYLHLSGWDAGGQEVRQVGDHLYHVLCMTCGMHLNIYMCLKVMQIVRKIRGRSSENAASFVNKISW